jgi:MFS family permease
MATLISAFPVGYLADKHGRSPMIAVGGAMSIVAAFSTAYVVWVAAEEDAKGHGPPDWALPTLAGCMVIWGISGGIVTGPAQALYADSISHGERSTWYTYLFAAWLVSSAIGPGVAVVLFKMYGNGWTLTELRTVMLVGLGLEVMATVSRTPVDGYRPATSYRLKVSIRRCGVMFSSSCSATPRSPI